MLKIAVLILAAGQSKRMGQVKALLPLMHQHSALATLVQLYRSLGLKDLYVVSGFHASAVEREAKSLQVEVVRNRHPEEGMFSSVRSGVRFLANQGQYAAAFIHPVDIPLVRPLTIRALLANYQKNFACNIRPALFLPCFKGREGHPPLLDASTFTHLLSFQGEGGLRLVLDGLFKSTIAVSDCLMLKDMDSPSDYARLKRLACFQDVLLPSEALELLGQAKVTEECFAHSVAVGVVAAHFALVLKHATDGQKNLCSWLALSGGLVHDIAKGQPHHEVAGARMLKEMGLCKMAEIVEAHRDLLGQDLGLLREHELVYLADKYCQGASFVPLKERFSQKMERFALDPLAKEAIAKRSAQAKRVEERFWQATGVEPALLASSALKGLSLKREQN